MLSTSAPLPVVSRPSCATLACAGVLMLALAATRLTATVSLSTATALLSVMKAPPVPALRLSVATLVSSRVGAAGNPR